MKAKPTSLAYAQTGFSALLALGAVSSASASVVASTTVGAGLRPPSSPGTIGWDVDGDGWDDFILTNTSGTAAGFIDTNGGRIFGFIGGTIGPFLNIGTNQLIKSGVSGYYFAANQQFVTITDDGQLPFNLISSGWAIDTAGYIGFKFTNITGAHFGWAQVTIDGTHPGSGFIITEAYYNTVPDQGLYAGTQIAVPEPATTATGLAALALGAATLRRWRKAKQAKA